MNAGKPSATWSSADVIDSLRVIVSRRGCKIQQGDVIAVEAAIDFISKATEFPMGDPHPCDMTPEERDRFFSGTRSEKPLTQRCSCGWPDRSCAELHPRLNATPPPCGSFVPVQCASILRRANR